ncbi:unnamed protein product [Agarophyton chilense]
MEKAYFSSHMSANMCTEQEFERRRRMPHAIPEKTREAVVGYDPYFVCNNDAVGLKGVLTDIKILISLREMCYGDGNDRVASEFKVGFRTAKHVWDFLDAWGAWTVLNAAETHVQLKSRARTREKRINLAYR